MPDDCQTTEVIWSSLVVDNAPLLNASLSVGGPVHRLTGTVPDSGTGTPVVLPYYFLEIIQVIRIIKYIIRIIHNTRAKSVYYPTLLVLVCNLSLPTITFPTLSYIVLGSRTIALVHLYFCLLVR